MPKSRSDRPQPGASPVLRAERQLALTCVHREGPCPAGVGTSLQLSSEGVLRADFQVESSLPFQTRPELQDPQSNWGLWEGDVVELFLQLQGPGSPYYEFQVSPLGQRFQLQIQKPRVEWDSSFRCQGFNSGVSRASTGGSWQARLEIPLGELGWDGEVRSIRGGAFAILGGKSERSYWAAFLPRQEKPDFHLPEEFRSFFVSA